MGDYKEFNGNTINDAIVEAVSFFGVDRERLEVEIISEGKSGIFGLVGSRKAVIRAKIRQDLGEVKRNALEILERMITPIAEAPIFESSFLDEGNLKINIETKGDAGLLIGRDGQTLAALQYLLNRILAKQCPGLLKVELDSGAYKQQRDEHLRIMALHLAEKVKSEGRPQSTKPLNSGHRRIVHLTLHQDNMIKTRSKGEGDLKRVLILPVVRSGERRAAAQPH